MSVRCGNPKHDKFVSKEHHHDSVDDVRTCYRLGNGDLALYSIEEEEHAAWSSYAENDPDAAYERHLEDVGYWEARADEEREIGLGIDPFNPLAS